MTNHNPSLVLISPNPVPTRLQEDKKGPPPLPKKPLGGVTGALRADGVGDGVGGGGVGGGGIAVGSGGGGGSGVGGSGTGAGAGSGGSGMLVVSRSGPGLPVREKSLDLGDRQRQETRRRLLQTKRSASFRQNSATESADSIEIYIPEAQTRL